MTLFRLGFLERTPPPPELLLLGLHTNGAEKEKKPVDVMSQTYHLWNDSSFVSAFYEEMF